MSVTAKLPRVKAVREPCIVIEVCQGCSQHQWNTRHREEQYVMHALAVASAVKQRTGWTTLFNQVPKKWHAHDQYVQLVKNDDPSRNVYDMMPRVGAFEVSVVISEGSTLTVDPFLNTYPVGSIVVPWKMMPSEVWAFNSTATLLSPT